MKLDQIAYYAHNEDQVEKLKLQFGAYEGEWIEDIATGDVSVMNGPSGKTHEGLSRGRLRFNYDLGIELEILTYLEGPHWHMDKTDFLLGRPFLSHLGFHMEKDERPPEKVMRDGLLVQVMNTTLHTNSYVNEKKRKYHYEIFKMPSGPDLKYIWRREGYD
jgi:hypothetical protein